MTSTAWSESQHQSTLSNPEWRRLSPRVLWIDFAVGIISLIPGVVALVLDPAPIALWMLLLATALGLLGACGDALRWLTTQFRVTETEVQRRSGIVFRRYRSLRRERIRSVDTHARLRHRLAGLRIVTIGAGQQVGADEAALELNSLSLEGTHRLREEILGAAAVEGSTDRDGVAQAPVYGVLETFKPHWVLYNVFSFWAYLVAAGLCWMAFWMLPPFGIDVPGMADRLVAGAGQSWIPLALIGLVLGGALGVLALGLMFIAANWNFELARVRSEKGSFLRTRRGLLTTREVNRDEARVRGISIDEPLLWRWMGMADTNVLTTGLSLSSSEEATNLVPRGPISVARRVAQYVVGDAYPQSLILPRHPRAALKRRIFWAVGITAGLIAIALVPIALGVIPGWTLWIAPGVGALALIGAYIAYRALGHRVHGDYLITRAGLLHRSTTVLRRDAVSTVVVSQSILQRRLGLSTVAFMTAAGWGAYDVPDVAASEALNFADEAAPGILPPFLEAGTPRQ